MDRQSCKRPKQTSQPASDGDGDILQREKGFPGRALLLSDTPGQLLVLCPYLDSSRYEELSLYEQGQAYQARPPSFSLMEALARGRLPFLNNLEVYEDAWCLKDEKISALLIAAITAGHLSCLQHFFLEGGFHVAVFLRAFGARFEGGGGASKPP